MFDCRWHAEICLYFSIWQTYILKRKTTENIITLYRFMSTMVIHVIVIKCNCHTT